MVRETQKIFGTEDIKITATCVRVPIFNSHSEALNLEFERKVTVEEARQALRSFPGVKVLDDPERGEYPLPLDASGTDEVYVGRIREDHSRPNALNLWVVSDNIRKGAALNAIQIAEKMIELGLLD
jgi:aspartate-semialdehyde dehydrogenase